MSGMRGSKVLLALMMLAWLALPAHAGIIITEGKIAEEQEPAKESAKDANSGRRSVAPDKGVDASEDEGDEAPAPACGDIDDDGFCVQVDGGVDDVQLKEVGDLNNDSPEGWDCTPIGAGIEVCEPDGPAGASPGAGAGGGLGDGVTMSGEPQVGGCQSGGQSMPLWLAFTVLLLGGLPRRSAGRACLRTQGA